MTDLDVELSRTVAELVAQRSGRRATRTVTATTAAAWILLAAAVLALVLG